MCVRDKIPVNIRDKGCVFHHKQNNNLNFEKEIFLKDKIMKMSSSESVLWEYQGYIPIKLFIFQEKYVSTHDYMTFNLF